MSGNTFAVVFSGELVEGANAEQVKSNFAQLFKVDIAKVAPMFSGNPVAIKKGIDEATALKYQQALRQAGALCRVVNMAPPQPTAAKPAQPVATPSATPAPATSAPTQAPAPASQSVSTAGGLSATLAEPGALLKEPEPFVPAQIETAHLSMGAVGETLVEPEEVPDLQVDTSALSMAEVGVQLIPPSNVEAAVIDVSKLSMAEAGALLQEPQEVPPAQIDTSKISLA